ncbi:hypothetical protein EPA93_36760 [Ktedonosporobacter rubrisoli]|uniref:DUF1080 domain-containing protein n=1 Tax=Ktedonosporobacter rubrisoli TaxID=2509675 RepID=A0A4P6JZQ4_KTERU|nr:hypothetical protein [Ktedonosporobacter rubrisoli]QBD81234.1 hypothetical protein EPA93_36760 [Ktedonosporobacter rubrisoli]
MKSIQHCSPVQLASLIALTFVLSLFLPACNESPTAPAQIPHPGYTTNAPGPQCDHGSGQWDVAKQYYTQDKKNIVQDKYTTLSCQMDGTQLTRSGDYYEPSKVYFLGPNADKSTKFPKNYRVQVDARISSPQDYAWAGLIVHTQYPAYGYDVFAVSAMGSWIVERYGNDKENFEYHLAGGYLPESLKAFTLTAEVEGALMRFSVNGRPVTTATDPTFANNFAVGFWMSNGSDQQPVSALFSHFSYVPLPDKSSLAPLTAQITPPNIAQAIDKAQMPYEARVPGFDCDKGGAMWDPPRVLSAGNNLSLRCQDNGQLFMINNSSGFLYEEFFHLYDDNMPNDYSVSVQIDTSQLGSDGCAGLGAHIFRGDNSGYRFFICRPSDTHQPDHWEVDRYDSPSKISTLSSGTIPHSDKYTMTVTAKDKQQSLILNGKQVASTSDSNNPYGYVTLFSSQDKGGSGSAVFSNFVFAPLL